MNTHSLTRLVHGRGPLVHVHDLPRRGTGLRSWFSSLAQRSPSINGSRDLLHTHTHTHTHTHIHTQVVVTGPFIKNLLHNQSPKMTTKSPPQNHQTPPPQKPNNPPNSARGQRRVSMRMRVSVCVCFLCACACVARMQRANEPPWS